MRQVPRVILWRARIWVVLAVMAPVTSGFAAAPVKYEVLRAFGAFSGEEPHGPLVQGADGAFYGTTLLGGARGGWGTVFRMSGDGSSFSILHSFGKNDGAYPSAGLLEGVDGFLYGTASYGGPNEFHGTVFKVAADGSSFSVLHGFAGTDGSAPTADLIQLADGGLYGTTFTGGSSEAGTVFRISTDGSSFSVLHHFDFSDGFSPSSRLALGPDGALYGTTRGGTLFRLQPDGSSFAVLHQFDGRNGRLPNAGLTLGLDGVFYGTTLEGGGSGVGTVFKISADGSSFEVLHSFDSVRGAYPNGELVWGSDGAFYGTTQYGGSGGVGTLFRISADGSSFEILHAFDEAGGPSQPLAGLYQGTDGAFYGATPYGGRSGVGAAFRWAADVSSLEVVHSFDNDGLYIAGGLVQGPDRALYGTTARGGATSDGSSGGWGAVFKLLPDGSGFSSLHGLSYLEGSNPAAAPVLGPDGAFYGTTSEGGVFRDGTVFRVSADGTSFSVLQILSGSQGENPYAQLLLGADGALYGTTSSGGAFGSGIAFRISADGSDFSVLHDFNVVTDGTTPSALVQSSDGSFYGTTSYGPTGARGAVFWLAGDGSVFSTLHHFDGPEFGTPNGAGLVEGREGLFYGTTSDGGSFGHGSVFKFSPDRSTFATLHSFNFTDGARPNGLVLSSDGDLYGTTYDGGAFGTIIDDVRVGYGTIFKIAIDGSDFSVLHSFDLEGGAFPRAPPVEGSDGVLYGTTAEGGPGNYGVVYRLGRERRESAVQFLRPVFTSSEAGKAVVVRVRRTGSTSDEMTVEYRTSDGTATAGLDYLATTGRLRFAPGAATLTLKVNLLGDKTHEGDESFLVSLLDPKGPGAALGAQDTAIVTIKDDDPISTLQLSAAAYSVLENALSANVTVRRTGPATDPVSIDFATLDGTATAPDDYLTTVTTVSFDAGVLSRTIAVAIAEDTLREGSESLKIELSNPVGATLGKRSGAELTIRDDDQTLQFPVWRFTSRENSGRAAITVRRSAGTTGTLSIDYTTSDGSATAHADYTPVTGQLVFGPGVTTRTFTVPVLNDILREGTEDLVLTLLNASPPEALGVESTAILTILDDEPVVQFSALRYATPEPVGAGTKQFMVTVVRQGQLNETVHVDYSTSGATAVAGKDYLDVAGRLTFDPGVAREQFAVPILGNSIDEPDRVLNLELQLVDIPRGTPSDAVLTIRDNDVAGTVQFDAAAYSGRSSSGSIPITITRTGGTAGPASVRVATRDGTAVAGSDYTATSGEVRFGLGETSKTFDVAITPSDPPNKYLTVTLGATTGNLRLGSVVESVVWIVE